jgi:predicted Zn-dependent protease with MMP-like domain
MDNWQRAIDNGQLIMTPQMRKKFDRLLQSVIDELPDDLHDLIEEVPLIVDDRPGPDVIHRMGKRDARNLCGLYTGIPLDKRSVEHSGTMPDAIYIFREGVLGNAAGDQGQVSREELTRQIRITVLHEIGHHFGLDEDDLRKAGYQ